MQKRILCGVVSFSSTSDGTTHGCFLADLSQLETTKILGVDVAAA
jgi:hypothetical protein